MKAISSLGYLIAAFSIFFSCAKNNEAPNVPVASSGPTTPSGPDVYVAGYDYNGSSFTATYWKNGVPVSLQPDNAITTSMFVSGNDVYCVGLTDPYGVGGTHLTGTAIVVWKNGVHTFVTDGKQVVNVSQIVVVGSDVYVAGEENDIVKYWKNGVSVALSDATTVGKATGIAIDGDDVYVSGWLKTGEIVNFVQVQIAAYWKNGVLIPLTDHTLSASTSSITVSNHNVYVTGRTFDGSSYNNLYWKNGASVELPQSSEIPTSISVFNNDVYVSGATQYWKNGIAVSLKDGTNQTVLRSIFVNYSDVYGVGEKFYGAGQVATLWKNGNAISLSKTPDACGAFSIFVQ